MILNHSQNVINFLNYKKKWCTWHSPIDVIKPNFDEQNNGVPRFSSGLQVNWTGFLASSINHFSKATITAKTDAKILIIPMSHLQDQLGPMAQFGTNCYQEFRTRDWNSNNFYGNLKLNNIKSSKDALQQLGKINYQTLNCSMM